MEIYITGEITTETFETFQEDVKKLKKNEPIDIFIASQGGSVDAGFTISNYISGLEKNRNVTTNILGNVDSIATVIFLAAKERYVEKGGSFMAHEPMVGFTGHINLDDVSKIKQSLEHERNRIADYYDSKIEGLTKDEILEGMSKELWLNSDQMQKLGIAKINEYSIAANNKLKDKIMLNFLKSKNEKPNIHVMDFDGVTVIWEGETINKGTEFLAADGKEIPNGEYLQFETEQGEKQFLVIEDSKLKEFRNEIPVNLEEEEVQDIAQMIAEAIAPLMERIDMLEGGEPEEEMDEVEDKKPELQEVKEVVEEEETEDVVALKAELTELKEKINSSSKAEIPKRTPKTSGVVNQHVKFQAEQIERRNEKLKKRKNIK